MSFDKQIQIDDMTKPMMCCIAFRVEIIDVFQRSHFVVNGYAKVTLRALWCPGVKKSMGVSKVDEIKSQIWLMTLNLLTI